MRFAPSRLRMNSYVELPPLGRDLANSNVRNGSAIAYQLNKRAAVVGQELSFVNDCFWLCGTVSAPADTQLALRDPISARMCAQSPLRRQTMTSIILMSSFLVVVAAIGGVAVLITRLLPVDHVVRLKVDAFVVWVRENPRLFEKRLKQVAFTLVVLFFLSITIIYS
jgi:hypothetical protein